jgi:hypothetical protein
MGADINFNKSLGRTYVTYIGLPAFPDSMWVKDLDLIEYKPKPTPSPF